MVAGWCERDSALPESMTLETLDCRACGACCRDNDVLLGKDDFARWRAAGRSDLEAPEFLRARKRKLRVLPSGDCVHLRGNDCGIYEVRPDNCRAFPAGSECCLFARDEQREKLAARATPSTSSKPSSRRTPSSSSASAPPPLATWSLSAR